jgi:hypothetical protein
MDVPIASDDDELANANEQAQPNQADLIQSLMARIKDLEDRLDKKKDNEEESTDKNEKGKLKPIDIKDIERPDKYDNNLTKFAVWYDKFKDLLSTRNENWLKLLEVIEARGKVTIKSQKNFMDEMGEEHKTIKDQATAFAQQLKSYLRTYTDGELHVRVTQTSHEDVMELMREVVYKGRNRNPNRLLDLKAKVLSPARANKVCELDKILTEWRHTRKLIAEEDAKYHMDDETMQTILLKIMPAEYVKDMREQLTQGKHVDDYHGFEQALFDEIATRKMDEDSRKSNGRINNVHNDHDDDHRDRSNNENTEFEQIEVWSDEWQCMILGLAPLKRSRSRSRSRGDDAEERPMKVKREETGKAEKGKGKGKRPAGPCWTCGGPHFQRECPELAKGGGQAYPISTAWSSWRPPTYPGPTPAQWNSWLPKPYKGKGKGKGKGIGKGGKGDKGKGKGQVMDSENISSGVPRWDTCPTGMTPGTCRSSARCARRSASPLRRMSRSGSPSRSTRARTPRMTCTP